jgi:hypothetical protein
MSVLYRRESGCTACRIPSCVVAFSFRCAVSSPIPNFLDISSTDSLVCLALISIVAISIVSFNCCSSFLSWHDATCTNEISRCINVLSLYTDDQDASNMSYSDSSSCNCSSSGFVQLMTQSLIVTLPMSDCAPPLPMKVVFDQLWWDSKVHHRSFR